MSDPITSEVALVNLALIRLAEDPITDLAGSSKSARIMNATYAGSRDALQRQYNWNFCRARVYISPELPAPTFGFTNKFVQPADCRRVVGLFDENEDTRNYTASRHTFKIEGRYILADVETLPLYYIRRVTNVGEFDDLFTQALAWKLAMENGYAITGGQDRANWCAAQFKDVIRSAKIANAIEGTPEVIESSDWLDSRYGQSPDGPFRAGPVV